MQDYGNQNCHKIEYILSWRPGCFLLKPVAFRPHLVMSLAFCELLHPANKRIQNMHHAKIMHAIS